MAGILLTPLGFWDSVILGIRDSTIKVAVSISIPGKKVAVSNWKSGSQLCIMKTHGTVRTIFAVRIRNQDSDHRAVRTCRVFF